MLTRIYTTIGGPSSKFDKFLAARSQFDAVAIRQRSWRRFFYASILPNPLPLCDRFLRFIVLFFLRKKNCAAFRHRHGDVYAARLMVLRIRSIALLRTMMQPLYGRLIARWRHGRWCHRYGKGSCFNSTRGHTGYILVISTCSYLLRCHNHNHVILRVLQVAYASTSLPSRSLSSCCGWCPLSSRRTWRRG